MSRGIGVFLAALAFAAGHANVQEATQGPGTLEVTIIPGGGMFVTGGSLKTPCTRINMGGMHHDADC